MGRLTVGMVKALKEPGRYGDGGTLYLVVAPGGSKSWVQRFTVNGKRRDHGLGGFPLVTLAEAREQAFENRRHAHRGCDPLADKRRVMTPTFEQAAQRALEANRGRWRNAKTADQLDRQSMAKYVPTPSSAIGASTRSAGKTCCACSRRSGRASPRSDARSDSASARRWPGRRRTTTSRTTRPARRSTPRSRRRRRSRCTSARCRTPMSGRRSTSSRRHGRPCRRGRACGSSCSLPAGPVRLALRPGREIDLDGRRVANPGGADENRPSSIASRSRALHWPCWNRSSRCADRFDLLFPSPSRPGKPLSDMTLTKVLTGYRAGRPRHGARLPLGVQDMGQ